MEHSELGKQWLNLARRMQQIAKTQKGYAVLSVKVVVGPSGDPELWFQPKMCQLEPISKSSDLMKSLLSVIGNEGEIDRNKDL